MKNMLEKVKNSKGFVSLETIAIAVIVVALAAFIMFNFRDTAKTSSNAINSKISSSMETFDQEKDPSDVQY